MKISSVKEFRDNATKLPRSNDPILVLRRGQLAGIFFPCPEKSMPLELKRELFPLLATEVARQMRHSGINEKELIEGFEEWKKRRHQKNRVLETGA